MSYRNDRKRGSRSRSGNNGTQRNRFIPCSACEIKFNLPKAKVPWIPFFKCYKGMELACPKCDVKWDEIARRQGFTPPNSPFREAAGNSKGPKNANGESPTKFGLNSFIDRLLGKKPVGESAEAELSKEEEEKVALEAFRMFNAAAIGERIDMSTAFHKARDEILHEKRNASLPPEGQPLSTKEFNELGKRAETLRNQTLEKKATFERKQRELETAKNNYHDLADKAQEVVNRYKQELLLQARANEHKGSAEAAQNEPSGRNGQETKLQEVGDDVILHIKPEDKNSFQEKAQQYNEKLRQRTEQLAALRALESELEVEQNQLRDEAKEKTLPPQQAKEDAKEDNQAENAKGTVRTSDDPDGEPNSKLRRGTDADDAMGGASGGPPTVLPGAVSENAKNADEPTKSGATSSWTKIGGPNAPPPSGSPAAIDAERRKQEEDFQKLLAETEETRMDSRPKRQQIKSKTAPPATPY